MIYMHEAITRTTTRPINIIMAQNTMTATSTIQAKRSTNSATMAKTIALRTKAPFPSFAPDNIKTSPVIGWFFNWQVCDTVPLYLLFNPWSKDYFTPLISTKNAKRSIVRATRLRASLDTFCPPSCAAVYRSLFRLYDRKHFYTISREEEEAISCGWKGMFTNTSGNVGFSACYGRPTLLHTYGRPLI